MSWIRLDLFTKACTLISLNRKDQKFPPTFTFKIDLGFKILHLKKRGDPRHPSLFGLK